MIRKFIAEIEKIIDSSILEIALFVTESRETLYIDKYRMHYMNSVGQVLFRYDNAPHHPNIDSHPHHKHTSAKISASNVPSIEDILNEISSIVIGRQI